MGQYRFFEQVEPLLLSGYHQQQITGIPSETLIEVYTYDSSPSERCYQGEGYFYSHKSPPTSKLKEISGLQIKSWQGKYSGEEFSIFPNIPQYIQDSNSMTTRLTFSHELRAFGQLILTLCQ